MVLGVSPKRLENQEENRFSKNRSEGGQPVDFRCSRPPPPACCGCGRFPLEGSAKTSDLSAAPNPLESSKKKRLRKVADGHEILSKTSEGDYTLDQREVRHLFAALNTWWVGRSLRGRKHFFLSSLLLSSSTRRRFYPQRSCGQAVVTGVVPSPRYMPSFLWRIGFSIPTAR